MYDLGIIGGMGPEATVEVFRRIILYAKADEDQEHMNICVLNIASIPDRSQAINTNNYELIIHLNKAIEDLRQLGIKRYIIACNTAHYFVSKLKKYDDLIFIDMVLETVKYIKSKGIIEAIILGTTGGNLIYKRVLGEVGIKVRPLDEKTQNKITKTIYDIKKNGVRKSHKDFIPTVITELIDNDLEQICILGCTELSLLKEVSYKRLPVIDPVDVVVIEAIKKCGFHVKDKYKAI